jgi:tetratricopeptide (TPR) repeat protein
MELARMLRKVIAGPLLLLCVSATSSRALAAPETQVYSPQDVSRKAKAKRTYAAAAVATYNRALELQNAGSLTEAALEYQKALAADERLHQAWDNLGLVYFGQKRYKEAQAAFEHSIQIAPDRPVSLNGYASTLYAQGRREEAAEVWRKIIKQHPAFKPAYYNLDQCGVSPGHILDPYDLFKEGGYNMPFPTKAPRLKKFIDDTKSLPPKT